MISLKMSLSIAAGAALAVLGVTTPAFAQTTQSAAAAPEQITRAEVTSQTDANFKLLDANKDGKVTKAEFEAAMSRQVANEQAEINQRAKAAFDKLDTNHNGQISLTEFQAQAKVSVDTAKVDARVQQIDANHDGAISADEYRAFNLAEFDKADTNHDGVVSAAEAGQGR